VTDPVARVTAGGGVLQALLYKNRKYINPELSDEVYKQGLIRSEKDAQDRKMALRKEHHYAKRIKHLAFLYEPYEVPVSASK
jgi:hypothetical protein